jgi:hypothetical protein
MSDETISAERRVLDLRETRCLEDTEGFDDEDVVSLMLDHAAAATQRAELELEAERKRNAFRDEHGLYHLCAKHPLILGPKRATCPECHAERAETEAARVAKELAESEEMVGILADRVEGYEDALRKAEAEAAALRAENERWKEGYATLSGLLACVGDELPDDWFARRGEALAARGSTE